MATGFDATLTGLGSIVCAALGPLLRVSPETALLDLERARMTAEDHAHRALRAEDHAHRALRDEDSESEETSDEEIRYWAASVEEERVFCEACDAYYGQGVVAWYTEPFMHNGRTLYSACGVCRWNLNLQDRPVDHW